MGCAGTGQQRAAAVLKYGTKPITAIAVRYLPRCRKQFDFANSDGYYFCTTGRVAPFQPDRKANFSAYS